MSDINSLETLSNKELRAKCLEFGLDVPVTSTSRKVLVRKLYRVMNGIEAIKTDPISENQSAKKKKGKPTTSSVSSVEILASTGQVRKNNRKVLPEFSANPQQQINRVDPLPIESAQSKQRKPISSKETPNNKLQLATSGVLTTSYTQETQPLPELVHSDSYDDEVDDYSNEEYSDVEYSDENSMTQSAIKIQQRQGISNESNRTNFDSIPYNFNFTPTVHDDILSSSNQHSRFPHLRQNEYQFGNRKNPARTYAEPEPERIDLAAHNYIYASSKNHYSLPHGQGNEPRFNNSYAETYAQPEAEIDFNSSDTPYLNEFSRKLEHIRMQPFLVDDQPNHLERYENISGCTASMHSPSRRKQVNYSYVEKRQEDPNDIGQLLNALERKYHIKLIFTLVLLFVIIVFIYSLFAPVPK